MKRISSMNRPELIKVGQNILSHSKKIKSLRRYAGYEAHYRAYLHGVSFNEERNDRLEALKDDVIQAQNHKLGSVWTLKRILKSELTTIRSYKLRKAHPSLAKRHDEEARRSELDLDEAGYVNEAKIERQADLNRYQMYVKMADRYKKRADNINSALSSQNYPKLRKILNRPVK